MNIQCVQYTCMYIVQCVPNWCPCTQYTVHIMRVTPKFNDGVNKMLCMLSARLFTIFSFHRINTTQPFFDFLFFLRTFDSEKILTHRMWSNTILETSRINESRMYMRSSFFLFWHTVRCIFYRLYDTRSQMKACVAMNVHCFPQKYSYSLYTRCEIGCQTQSFIPNTCLNYNVYREQVLLSLVEKWFANK